MSDFFWQIVKGVFPFYFLFFLLGCWSRIARKKWTSWDTLLAAAFFFYETAAALQVPLFYGVYIAAKRYLWVALPLALPLAAEGVDAAGQYLAGLARRKWIPAVLWLVIIAVNLHQTFSPVVHARWSAGKTENRKTAAAAAEWIRRDWQGRVTPPVTFFHSDFYQSGKRPLVLSEVSRVGWLCGGQDYPAFLKACGVRPDYLVTRTPAEHPGYRQVKTVGPVIIYRLEK